eukprot:SAG25_NODE_113_length_14872_cov_23.149527_8_plen_116_part_00
MMAHHFVTIGMLCGAYGLGVLRVSHAILVEQDLADIFLPAAKMCASTQQPALVVCAASLRVCVELAQPRVAMRAGATTSVAAPPRPSQRASRARLTHSSPCLRWSGSPPGTACCH